MQGINSKGEEPAETQKLHVTLLFLLHGDQCTNYIHSEVKRDQNGEMKGTGLYLLTNSHHNKMFVKFNSISQEQILPKGQSRQWVQVYTIQCRFVTNISAYRQNTLNMFS